MATQVKRRLNEAVEAYVYFALPILCKLIYTPFRLNALVITLIHRLISKTWALIGMLHGST